MTPVSKAPWQGSSLPAFGVKRSRKVKYTAVFWCDPRGDGQHGRYRARDCEDVLVEMQDGRLNFLNTSPSVSYYDKLMKWAKA